MGGFELPYFNELTANQLGLSTEFGAYTPTSYIQNSLYGIANFMDQQPCPYVGGCGAPRTTTPGEFERVMRGRPRDPEQIPPPDPNVIPMPPSVWKTNPPPDVPIGTPGTQTPENVDKMESQWNFPAIAESILKSDAVVATGLITIAIIIIIIGVLSFR